MSEVSLRSDSPGTVLGHYCKQGMTKCRQHWSSLLVAEMVPYGGRRWPRQNLLPPTLLFAYVLIVLCRCFWCMLVWLSFGLALKYCICVVCGTLFCTHLPIKFGVGPLLPPLHLLIIKHGRTLEWRTCNWVT